MIVHSLVELLPARYRQFGRYIVTGGLATLIHYGFLAGLVELAHLDETLSTAIGVFFAASFHYLLSYHWTFVSTARHGAALIRFVTVLATSMVLNTTLFWVLNEILGLWYLFAQVLTTGTLVFVNFLMHSRFTFAVR